MMSISLAILLIKYALFWTLTVHILVTMATMCGENVSMHLQWRSQQTGIHIFRQYQGEKKKIFLALDPLN